MISQTILFCITVVLCAASVLHLWWLYTLGKEIDDLSMRLTGLRMNQSSESKALASAMIKLKELEDKPEEPTPSGYVARRVSRLEIKHEALIFKLSDRVEALKFKVDERFKEHIAAQVKKDVESIPEVLKCGPVKVTLPEETDVWAKVKANLPSEEQKAFVRDRIAAKEREDG